MNISILPNTIKIFPILKLTQKVTKRWRIADFVLSEAEEDVTMEDNVIIDVDQAGNDLYDIWDRAQSETGLHELE